MHFKKDMFKRLLCAALACASIMAFTACSDRNEENNSSSSDISSSSSSENNADSSKEDDKSEASKEDSKDNSSKEDDKKDDDKKDSNSSSASGEKTVNEKIKEAQAINSDVIGWLTVPNTKIDNEVLQAADNDFYLRRDINKNYEWYGCYYADKDAVVKDRASLSPNTVIYGHNMEDRPNGKKFAQLMNYLNEDFAKNNPYVYLETPTEKLTFEVFAVFYTDAVYSSYYAFVDPVKDSAKVGKNITLGDIIEDSKLRSQYIYDVDVDGNDKILTLSTCTYKYGGEANKEQRFVIQAKLIDEGEPEKATASFKKNPNPKEPRFTKEY